MEQFEPIKTLTRNDIVDILKKKDTIDSLTQEKIDEYANTTGLKGAELAFHVLDIYIESRHTTEAVHLLKTIEIEHPELTQRIKEMRYGIVDSLL